MTNIKKKVYGSLDSSFSALYINGW